MWLFFGWDFLCLSLFRPRVDVCAPRTIFCRRDAEARERGFLVGEIEFLEWTEST